MVEPGTSQANLCPCGCGRPLPPPARTGRPRVYFSTACRKRAERNRAENANWVPSIDRTVLHVPPPAPVAHQLACAIGEVDSLCAVLLRLAVEHPSPIMAAKCERLGIAIYEALKADFDEVLSR